MRLLHISTKQHFFYPTTFIQAAIKFLVRKNKQTKRLCQVKHNYFFILSSTFSHKNTTMSTTLFNNSSSTNPFSRNYALFFNNFFSRPNFFQNLFSRSSATHPPVLRPRRQTCPSTLSEPSSWPPKTRRSCTSGALGTFCT